MKIALYSWAGMGNIGDDWLLKCLLESPLSEGNEFLIITEPGAKLTGEKSQDSVLPWPKNKTLLLKRRKFYRQLNDCNMLILAGGGWFAADRNSKEIFNWFRRFYGVKLPIYTLGLGFGPFTFRFGRKMAAITLKRMEKLMPRPFHVRTMRDGTELVKLGISEFNLGADLAFADQDFIQEVKSEFREGIVVALPYLREELRPSNLESWTVQLRNYCEELGERVEFISMQSGEVTDYSFWNTYFENHYEVDSVETLKKLLSKTKYLVAGRLHSAIIGLASGVPNIMLLSYHHKFELLELFGLEPIKFGDESLKFYKPDYSVSKIFHSSVLAEIEAICGITKL